MQQLKIRNPQALKKYEELRGTNGNPQELLNQITSKYTPEQIKQFRQVANSFGVTNEQLDKYGINVK
jgi:hypothetical protein